MYKLVRLGLVSLFDNSPHEESTSHPQICGLLKRDDGLRPMNHLYIGRHNIERVTVPLALTLIQRRKEEAFVQKYVLKRVIIGRRGVGVGLVSAMDLNKF